MKRIIPLLFLVLISGSAANSQPSQKEVPLILEKLYGRLMKDSVDNDRLRINDSIRMFIDGYASSDSIFTTRYSNLKYLGQITSSDSLVKILTWNLVMSKGTGIYFCYLVRKNPSGPINTVYRLSANYNPDPILTDTVYNQKNWYGALYYDIKPFTASNRKSWVLLGVNFSNPLITSKIIEVLSFTPENNIVFGRKWFDTGTEIRYRDVFEYASNGMMSMKFVSDRSIIFDHLVPVLPYPTSDHQFWGPDYSYDAYTYDNGLWTLTINVDVRNKE